MKGLMVFFTLALVASSSAKAPVMSKDIDKGVIDDALALKACLEKAIPALMGSIAGIKATVEEVTGLVSSYEGRIQDCLAIGGDNPSLIDHLQQAKCMTTVVGDIIKDVSRIAVAIEGEVVSLIAAGAKLTACFPQTE